MIIHSLIDVFSGEISIQTLGWNKGDDKLKSEWIDTGGRGYWYNKIYV